MKTDDAFARMSDEEAWETEAYALGVQTVLLVMQWVKGGQAFRIFSGPPPSAAAARSR
jgi:hypothetical protein